MTPWFRTKDISNHMLRSADISNINVLKNIDICRHYKQKIALKSRTYPAL